MNPVDIGDGHWVLSAFVPVSEINAASTQVLIIGVSIGAAAIVIMTALLMAFMKRIISNPINRLTSVVNDAVSGRVNIQIDRSDISQDEVGQLTEKVYALVEEVKTIVNDLTQFAYQLNTQGDLDYHIDENRFVGAYRDMVVGINEISRGLVDDTLMLIDTVEQVATGNFGAELAHLPGKKANMNVKFNMLTGHIKHVHSTVHELANKALAGDFNIQADAASFKGDWAELVIAMNRLIKTVAERANWYESVLDAVPLPVFVTDPNMKLVFINKATETLMNIDRKTSIGKHCSSFGTEICNTKMCAIECVKRGANETSLTFNGQKLQVAVASFNDLSGKVAGYMEVLQDVTKIQNMVEKLDSIVKNVKSVSAQLTSGAKNISENSQNLAHGAVVQASSIEELNASIDIISDKISKSLEAAKTASNVSQEGKLHAASGNDEMRAMLAAMDHIKAASGNIAGVIKTISDIAFQTNLLALNASVEAARAGEHGKGFAVVADEVRNLASKSQNAANETNDLILDTVSKVEEGVRLANSTASVLETIVQRVSQVSSVIDEMAALSKDQSDYIVQIVDDISQISAVTQSNTAASEEAAAASQELASQSALLDEMFRE
jgi:methyl-accepting chemotaxis protein